MLFSRDKITHVSKTKMTITPLSLKPEEEWSKVEDDLALGNNKALNALFNGVDKNIFRSINNCNVAKDA